MMRSLDRQRHSLNLSRQAIAQHLDVLQAVGLVHSEREGRSALGGLDAVADRLQFFDCEWGEAFVDLIEGQHDLGAGERDRAVAWQILLMPYAGRVAPMLNDAPPALFHNEVRRQRLNGTIGVALARSIVARAVDGDVTSMIKHGAKIMWLSVSEELQVTTPSG